MELLRDPSVGVGRRDQLERNVEGCKDAIQHSQQLIASIDSALQGFMLVYIYFLNIEHNL